MYLNLKLHLPAFGNLNFSTIGSFGKKSDFAEGGMRTKTRPHRKPRGESFQYFTLRWAKDVPKGLSC